MISSDPDVTVCITAYKSGRMIEPTLRSVRAQTYPGFRVLISIDGAHAETEAICRAESDERFEVIIQPSRLGWVGNTNALLDRVATPYFFILPHDDPLAERYIEALRQELIAHPAAVNAYSDVELFGNETRVRTKSGLDGDLPSRMAAFLNPRSTSWIPWRGLTRSSALATGLRMRDNRYDGFASHANYIVGLLCLGPFRRVAETLYYHRDRDDADAVRTGHFSQPAEGSYAAWLEHVLQCMETVSTFAVRDESDARDRRTLLQMMLLEFLTKDLASKVYRSSSLSSMDRLLAVAGDMLARMHALPHFGAYPDYEVRPGSELGRMTAKLRVAEARQAIAQKQFAAAELAAASAIGLDPQNGEAHLQSGIALKRRGALQEALAAMRSARELLPENPRALLLLADLLARTGNPAGAVAQAEAALALRPGWGQAYRDLSRYLDACGRRPEALEAARIASEADPARFETHYEKMKVAPARSLAHG